MQEFLWLDHMPGENLEGGIELANQLYWHITWGEYEQHWYVWSGESLLLKTDSRETAEAFLYGLGLAYAAIPEFLFQRLEKGVKDLLEAPLHKKEQTPPESL